MSTIELAAPRVISFTDRGMQFKLKLARITKRQWLKYFESIVSTSENQNGKRIDHFDSTSARVELMESALIDAEGYSTADGSPVTSTQGWQQLVPVAHRLCVGEALVSVERGTFPEGGSLVLGAEPVYLNAVWGADESGTMLKYRNLCHVFKSATAEQQRRLSRESSRSVIVGGSRRGTTRWMGAQPALAEIYDELILSVTGYAFEGAPLGDDRDAIVAEMDTFHKVAAADVLFAPAQVNLNDEAE